WHTSYHNSSCTPRLPPCIESGCRFVILLFLSGSGAHRDLHSFPTRRSSDLAVVVLPTPRGPAKTKACASLLLPSALRRPSSLPRSEEHTSELQSLRHLVCRLLLEKKKRHKLQQLLPPSLIDLQRVCWPLCRV